MRGLGRLRLPIWPSPPAPAAAGAGVAQYEGLVAQLGTQGAARLERYVTLTGGQLPDCPLFTSG